MQEAISTATPASPGWLGALSSGVRAEFPTLIEWLSALGSAALLIFSFPNFQFAPLAWIALVPLLVTVVRRPNPFGSFLLGWTTGTLFFYGSTHWLTYSMIHYGGLPLPVAYLLLLPGAVVVGLFPALFTLILAIVVRRIGSLALLLAPVVWSSMEWFRLAVTGQLWNALGYSQAEFLQALLIQPARWGGVYAVSFLLLTVNSAVALLLVQRTRRSWLIAVSLALLVAGTVALSIWNSKSKDTTPEQSLYVVAVQPNVPMSPVKTTSELKDLLERHLVLSKNGLAQLPVDDVPRLVVWPESPMNFTYARDKSFQELVTTFTSENHTSLLLNSLEPAPNDGGYNSALLLNEKGRLIAQYDKIRLMPFGEYVPLPHWMPGASLITGLVGEFTPGNRYTMMPVGNVRAGTFICIESAYPWIARSLTANGAAMLINISNDGYLGPTAVMHQHLANTVFRAVENGRWLLRVTNTGITAEIGPDGVIHTQTAGFQPAVVTWQVRIPRSDQTFYTRHGDLFVGICSIITALTVILSLFFKRSFSYSK